MTAETEQLLAITHLACNPAKNVILMVFGDKFMSVCAKTGNILALPDSIHLSEKTTFIPDAMFPTDTIRSLCIHEESGMFATVADDKTLSCWKMDTFERTSQIELLKRANAVCFSKDGTRLVVGDKFGDVYTCATAEPKGWRLLLGHVSMILDVTFSPCGTFIMTADRDEKIRTSHYPNAFDIQSFCLGHTEYISRIHIPIFAPHILISGGGDGSVCVWDYKRGQLLSSFGLSDNPSASHDTPHTYSVSGIISTSISQMVCVLLETAPFVLLLSLCNDGLILKQKIMLDRDVLSACFDAQAHIWVSFGTCQGNKPLSSTLVGLIRYNQQNNIYEESIDTKCSLVAQVNATGTAKITQVPDYYQTGKLGKDSIIQKFHRRDENGKFQPKRKEKESEVASTKKIKT